MKRNTFLRTLAVAMLGSAALQIGAQGIYVNKKNGESIAYPMATLDKVTPYAMGTSTTTYTTGVTATLKYSKIADMKTPRIEHQVFPSGDGIVVVGGHTTGFELTQTAEIYQNGQWRDLSIGSPHDGAFSVILSDGRVMVGGGFSSRAGVGHSKNVDIYDPKTQAFTKGPDLTVARTYAKAVAVDGEVYVNGNWWSDGDATKMDIYDGSSFRSVSGMQERCNPYMFAAAGGKIWTWASLDKSGKAISMTSGGGYPFIEYLASTGQADEYTFTTLATDKPLPLTNDVRPSDSYSAALDSYFFLTLNGNGEYNLCRTSLVTDQVTGLAVDIPTTYPGTQTTITYRGGVLVNDAKKEVYLIGSSGSTSNLTVYLMSYNYDKGYWTIAKAEGFGHNLMTGAWTLLTDGRVVCAGGGIKDNYDAQKMVYVFTPPTAGEESSGSTQDYGVDVWKTDGSHDNYLESDLESITTY